jgi:hypothetical protein
MIACAGHLGHPGLRPGSERVVEKGRKAMIEVSAMTLVLIGVWLYQAGMVTMMVIIAHLVRQ